MVNIIPITFRIQLTEPATINHTGMSGLTGHEPTLTEPIIISRIPRHSSKANITTAATETQRYKVFSVMALKTKTHVLHSDAVAVKKVDEGDENKTSQLPLCYQTICVGYCICVRADTRNLLV
ncbi:hypothetical protein Y032_0044g970 [Ancylostoma ceylanicum]|uniref:Uncharacterized protein n=1 Tax=Ancylostoma ceylanicum TaxID=53326 RepID=A0A016UEQ1_9BILA|nr:hypothetical protein Y032_0044g970 [Ancylostoma ceylanicum]